MKNETDWLSRFLKHPPHIRVGWCVFWSTFFLPVWITIDVIFINSYSEEEKRELADLALTSLVIGVIALLFLVYFKLRRNYEQRKRRRHQGPT